jgi:hypothetical protein
LKAVTNMQLTASLTLPHRHRRVRHDRARPRTTSRQADLRAKRSSGPQDRALYACQCGYAFTAEVSTSVGCPHCGTSQAW